MSGKQTRDYLVDSWIFFKDKKSIILYIRVYTSEKRCMKYFSVHFDKYSALLLQFYYSPEFFLWDNVYSRHTRICISTGHSLMHLPQGHSHGYIHIRYTQYMSTYDKARLRDEGKFRHPSIKKKKGGKPLGQRALARACFIPLVCRCAPRPPRNTTPFTPIYICPLRESDCTSDEPPGARSHDKCAMGIFTRESLIPPWESRVHTSTSIPEIRMSRLYMHAVYTHDPIRLHLPNCRDTTWSLV